jgi:CubicO group peptidase (beta-lactamase class C family)
VQLAITGKTGVFMTIHRRHFLAASAGVAMCGPAMPARAASSLDLFQFMADGMGRTHTPGMAVAVVRHGETVMAAGVGLADIAANRPVTQDTAFHIASVSKTVTATAMMMQAQGGAFGLDDPIDRYLDFKVVHPAAPDTPITFRHLMTHTSGIADKVYYQVPAFSGAGDPTIGLRDFLVGYLTPQGQWYKADGCFGAAPGAAWDYSNVAVALLGYLSGRVGRDLKAFTQDELFTPLGMRHTSWTYAGLRPDDVAVAYDVGGATPKALPPTGYPDWPDGLLRTSARDFARVLAVYTAGGTLDGHAYLRPETLAAMLTPQALPGPSPDGSVRQGLIWQLRTLGDTRLASHSGGDPGASTVVAIDIDRKVAVLAFANAAGDDAFRPFQKELVQRLLAYQG